MRQALLEPRAFSQLRASRLFVCEAVPKYPSQAGALVPEPRLAVLVSLLLHVVVSKKSVHLVSTLEFNFLENLERKIERQRRRQPAAL